MLPVSEAEANARSRGDWADAIAIFKKAQDEFHKVSNRTKNDALYADWADNEFMAPHERITKDMLAEITDRNAEFLGFASNSLNMLKRMQRTPDEMRDVLTNFVTDLERLRGKETVDLESEFKTLLSNFVTEGVCKFSKA